MRVEGAAAYRDFMGPFVQILERAELLAAFRDDEILGAGRVPHCASSSSSSPTKTDEFAN